MREGGDRRAALRAERLRKKSGEAKKRAPPIPGPDVEANAEQAKGEQAETPVEVQVLRALWVSGPPLVWSTDSDEQSAQA